MTGARPAVVGIDVGSGAVRCLAVDPEGGVVARHVVAHDRSGGSVSRPVRWLERIDEAMAALAVSPQAVAVGGFGPVTVASTGDEALTFRHPIGDAGDPHAQLVAQGEELRRRHGTHVGVRQLWDWIADRLAEPSGAQSVWPGDRVVPGFGDPVPVGTATGVANGAHGVPVGTPIVPASNDAYLTAWAVGIDRPGRGFDPGGRTGGLGVAIRSDDEAAPYGMPSAVPGVVVVGGPTAAHGAMLDWWSAVTETGVASLIDEAAAVDLGTSQVVVLPYLEGERAPRWNGGLRGEIVGLGIDDGRPEVTRAILESTAFGLRHIADSVRADGGVLETLVCCGTPATSQVWVDIKAAVLGVPIEIPEPVETAAYGAALAAGAAVGWWPAPGEGSTGDWPMPPRRVVRASPDPLLEERYRRFVALGDAAEARGGA